MKDWVLWRRPTRSDNKPPRKRLGRGVTRDENPCRKISGRGAGVCTYGIGSSRKGGAPQPRFLCFDLLGDISCQRECGMVRRKWGTVTGMLRYPTMIIVGPLEGFVPSVCPLHLQSHRYDTGQIECHNAISHQSPPKFPDGHSVKHYYVFRCHICTLVNSRMVAPPGFPWPPLGILLLPLGSTGCHEWTNERHNQAHGRETWHHTHRSQRVSHGGS